MSFIFRKHATMALRKEDSVTKQGKASRMRNCRSFGVVMPAFIVVIFSAALYIIKSADVDGATISTRLGRK